MSWKWLCATCSLTRKRQGWTPARRNVSADETYCVVRDGGATHYGGVSHWRIADGTLVLTLDREAEAALGAREFVIGVPPAGEDAIDAALRRLLA